jgi:hypothetical protein
VDRHGRRQPVICRVHTPLFRPPRLAPAITRNHTVSQVDSCQQYSILYCSDLMLVTAGDKRAWVILAALAHLLPHACATQHTTTPSGVCGGRRVSGSRAR